MRRPVFFVLSSLILVVSIGAILIGFEQLPLIALGVFVLLIVTPIIVRGFFASMLFLFLISLVIPLLARFGPVGLANFQSLGKLGILGVSVSLWALSVLDGRSLKMSRPMAWFAIAWVVSFGFFLLRSLMDLSNGIASQDVISSFQRFGFAYILLAIVTYDRLRDLRWVVGFLRLLVICGIPVAIFGIFQWIVGPDALQAIGMKNLTNVVDDFGYYSYSGMSLFRAFSTLSNHGDLAAFMIITILATLTLYWMGRLRLVWTILATGVMGVGLLVTQNVTGLVVLVCVLALVVWLVGQYNGKRKKASFRRWRQILLFLLVLGVIFGVAFTNDEFRFRIVSSFTLGEGNPSLTSRFHILTTSLETFAAHPFGIGPDLEVLPNGVTMDVYLVFLLVTGGLPIFLFYIWLYVLPVLYGWRALRTLRYNGRLPYIFYCVLWAWVAVGALIGGFTNSAVTTASPSNLIFWCGVGVLYKIPQLISQATPEQFAEWGMREFRSLRVEGVGLPTKELPQAGIS